MAIDFNALKRDRSSQLDAISKTLKAFTPTEDKSDDKYWKPTVDEAGNGSAIIRFLPAPSGESVPFVRFWNHAFKGPGGWYIENSLTTIGDKDPVSELNTELWNTGTEANKNKVREQKRKLHYVSNIYVVKDPGNPDNEGKVFLFQYGKKIFDKIQDIMTPDELDDDKGIVNPFDLWEGANFRLKIRKVEGYRNYDKSEFDRPGPLNKDDSVLEQIWKSEHSLSEVITKDKFKSYDELKARLYRVLGLSGGTAPAAVAASNDVPAWEETEERAPVARTAPAPKVATTADDDDISFFSRLAEDNDD